MHDPVIWDCSQALFLMRSWADRLLSCAQPGGVSQRLSTPYPPACLACHGDEEAGLAPYDQRQQCVAQGECCRCCRSRLRPAWPALTSLLRLLALCITFCAPLPGFDQALALHCCTKSADHAAQPPQSRLTRTSSAKRSLRFRSDGSLAGPPPWQRLQLYCALALAASAAFVVMLAASRLRGAAWEDGGSGPGAW